MSLDELSLVYEQDSQIQNIRLYEDGDNKIGLVLNSYFQFLEGEDEFVYHNALVNSALEINAIAKKFLILGGGDGLGARNVLAFNPYADITIVEIDEEVIKLFMQTPRLTRLNEGSLFKCNVVIDDVLKWVPKCKEKFDVIINDLPDGNSEELKKLYTREFLTQVLSLLNKKGVISIQTHLSITDEVSIIIEDLLKHYKIVGFLMPYLGEGNVVLGRKN